MDDIKRKTYSRTHVATPLRQHAGSRPPVLESPQYQAHAQATNKRVIRISLRFGVPRRLLRTLVRRFRPYLPSQRKYPRLARVGWGLMALLMVGSIFIEFFNLRQADLNYELSAKAQTLLSRPSPVLAQSLRLDAKSDTYHYNQGYVPGGDVAGQISTPKFTGSFSRNPEQGVKVTDPVNNISVTFKPEFALAEPIQDQNRLVYPFKGRDAQKVHSLKSIGMKEDIILNSFQGGELSFKYKLELPSGTEARMESNGSLAIYGAQAELLGDIATGSEKDAKLLQRARENAPKKTLLFTFPTPFVREFNKKISNAKAWFELDGDTLTLNASGLEGASYPLSVDPSVYIETAAKLMRGNNETNVDFDIDEQLIQKSQTTGARIDAWEDNLDMSQATFDHATAAAGGYIYRVGGQTGPTRPQIVDQTETLVNSGSGTFTMNMPATRPAGDLYIALMCYDGSQGDGSGGSTAGNTIGTPSGWTKYANRNGHAAYYKIGTDQGGGNEASSYAFTGDNEKWGGVIMRVTGVDTSDPISGTAGLTHSNTSAIPQFPATTPDTDGTLVVRAVGADDDEPSAAGWVPAGHTKIASGGPTGTGDCAYMAASLDVPPASGVSTGTATMADNLVNDDYGASSIAINGVSVTPALQTTVNWARFNSSTHEIESPNPGEGTCSGWCSDSGYSLPEGRRGHSLVAYNGYLYVVGGSDGTNLESTVLIAKLGANGEPQLWHPTDTNPANWVYWYSDTGLNGSVGRAYHAVYAYKNKMYVLGGDTNTTANSGAVTTVEMADILPNGRLGSWSSGQALPTSTGRYGHTVHVYNDTMYLIGGNNNGTMLSTVYYSKLNSDGTMNSWVQTLSFSGLGRSSHGGNMTTVWGAYIYLMGGCTAVNGSGYCTGAASDTQLASINADGSLSDWGTITNLENQRIGFSVVGWQGGLYRLGGCVQQNASTGECGLTLADVDFGVVNPSGEASTVGTSFASGAAPCSGGSPYNCDLPSASVGNVLNASVVANGYLYIMGGCTNNPCNSYSSGITYQSIGSNGALQRPASCAGTYTDSYCVSSTSLPASRGAASPAVFNGRIYLVGGFPNRDDITYATVNNDGSLGTWTSPTFASLGVSESLAYSFAYARANPSSAGTNPGNLYIFGGCDGNNGVGCSAYSDGVYKCNIGTSGAPSGCTTTGQLQIGTVAGANGTGLGAHAGAVYANYIYLMGGLAPNALDLTTVYYAKFDDSNNVVTVGTGWVRTSNDVLVGRRRGAGFGYNGYLYVTGGYDGSEALADIEYAKIDVSTGDIGAFNASSVSISRRWGLTVPVSNSYAYVIGGCTVGDAPTGCTTRTNTIQTFQIYNNESGAIKSVTSLSDDTFAASTDRWGASSTVLNGYLYVAGGCIVTTDCSGGVGGINATGDVQYAAISATDGSIGTWASTTKGIGDSGSGAQARAWGKLVTAGGYLYYIGGQDSTATNEQSAIYYVQPSSGNITANWGTATKGIGDTGSGAQARTKFSAAVWNNRIYVIGGLNSSAAVTNTVYISPQLNSGGDISSNWISDSDVPDVSRFGAALVVYANNLYLFGGNDGTNYLNDGQYASLGYKTGTISQSGTTVTGSGTTFTSAQVGSTIQYNADGSTATITGFTNATTITVSASKTVSAGSTYVIQDGSVGAWTFTTSTPGYVSQAEAFAANGYIYLVGGRSATSSCAPNTLIAPVSANTTIVSGNNPTGVGEWFETNARYAGGRYGAAVAYDKGKVYIMGGGCTSPQAGSYSAGTIAQTGTAVTGTGTNWTDNYIGATITYADASTATVISVNSTTSLTASVSKTVTAGGTYTIAAARHTYSIVKSQPQVAMYSRMIDTDSDVFPNAWLMNGLDNSIGARWQMRYRSMHDLDTAVNPDEDCGTSATMAAMTTWGQETNFGDVTPGKVETYTPLNSSGGNINCARYYYFSVSIDASQTFGYPEDVTRGPTITDLSLFFTSDPSKRLRHGKTFTGGEQQPLDTPCRRGSSVPGDPNYNCPLP